MAILYWRIPNSREKWLKDRKGTELDFNAIIHYSNILYVLVHNESLAEGGQRKRPGFCIINLFADKECIRDQRLSFACN